MDRFMQTFSRERVRVIMRNSNIQRVILRIGLQRVTEILKKILPPSKKFLDTEKTLVSF